jgi:hypothetical protein
MSFYDLYCKVTNNKVLDTFIKNTNANAEEQEDNFYFRIPDCDRGRAFLRVYFTIEIYRSQLDINLIDINSTDSWETHKNISKKIPNNVLQWLHK